MSRLNLIGFPNKFNRTPDINRIGSILSWNIHILPEHLSADVSSTYELSKLAEFSKALANIFTSTFWTFSLSRLNLIGFPNKFNRTPDINRIGSILSWNIHILPEHLSADVSSTCVLSKLAGVTKALAKILLQLLGLSVCPD